MSELNIYQRLNEVRKEVKYIKKDIEVQGYTAVTHDQVTAIVRESLIKNGVMVVPHMHPGEVSERKYKSGSGYIQLRSMIDVAFVNIDKPEDMVTMTVEAHADDQGDKAPGKALSYGVKYALLKILSMETGDQEESRATGYTPQQKAAFDELVLSEDSIGMYLMQLRIDDEETWAALFNSWPKGEKTKMKAKSHEVHQKGFDQLKAVERSLDEGDKALAAESVEMLTTTGKSLLRSFLGRESIDHLNSLLRDAEVQEV